MAVALAVAVAVIVGAFWQVRGSDNAEVAKQLSAINNAMAQMSTNLAAEARINAADKRADGVVIDSLNKSVEELKRQTTLLSLQYAEMSKQMSQRR